MTTRALVAAALLAALGTAFAQQPKPVEPAKPAAPKGEKPDIPKLLATRVTVPMFNGKFKDAVKMLSEEYDLPILVDVQLGEGDAPAAMCEAVADDKPVKLPKFTNVRLDSVMKVLAEQVGGKYLVYPDYVKIVPNTFAAYESGVLTDNPSLTDDAPLLTQADLLRTKPLIKRALVTATYKNKTLSEVLDDIAESTGANVALSPVLPAPARQGSITVRFANTPVDAAVRTLCEMTECGVIEDANVLLVTTRERAAARAKEEAQKQKDRHPSPQQQVFVGANGFGLPSQPDLSGEIAKLKEQNEQLKKELEEVKKMLKK